MPLYLNIDPAGHEKADELAALVAFALSACGLTVSHDANRTVTVYAGRNFDEAYTRLIVGNAAADPKATAQAVVDNIAAVTSTINERQTIGRGMRAIGQAVDDEIAKHMGNTGNVTRGFHSARPIPHPDSDEAQRRRDEERGELHRTAHGNFRLVEHDNTPIVPRRDKPEGGK